MARLSVITLSVLVLAAIPTIATATHSPGKGPKHDQVVGSARFSVPVASVRINAKSGPNGENPRGHFFLSEFGWQFRGSVTCVRVVGHLASVGGRVTGASGVGAPPVGSGFIQLTQDNGSPGRNDRSQTIRVASPPSTCPVPTTPAFVLARGNYVVHDASQRLTNPEEAAGREYLLAVPLRLQVSRSQNAVLVWPETDRL